MKNWIIGLILVGLIATPVIGQAPTATQVVAVGIQANDGLYVLRIEGGEVAGLAPLPIISPNGPAPQPNPNPNPNPQPSDLTDFAKEVRDAALLATTDPDREATAATLAAAFRELAKKVVSGDLTDREMIALATKITITQVLRGKSTAAQNAWGTARAAIGDQFDEIAQAGGSDGDYADCLNEAADGLQASAPNAPLQIDIAMILMIIEMILEILKNLPF